MEALRHYKKKKTQTVPQLSGRSRIPLRPGVTGSAADRSHMVTSLIIRISAAVCIHGRLVVGQREKVYKAEPEETNGEK